MVRIAGIVLSALIGASVVGAAGAGCSVVEPSAQSVPMALMSGGRIRSYRLYRPASLPEGTRPPVVIVLHGAGLTPEQTERAYGWDALADTHAFEVAYPRGIGRTWNAGSCCAPANAADVDDVGFVARLIDAVVADGADPDRVYLAGMSNGAMLAYRFACERPGRLAAVGVVAGTLTAPCPDPRPVPLIAVHGLADGIVVFQPGPDGPGAPGMQFPAMDAVARWRAVDDCIDPRATITGSVRLERAACAPGLDVTLVTVQGMGHEWPGGARIGSAPRPTSAVDATTTLWSFFATHPGSA